MPTIYQTTEAWNAAVPVGAWVIVANYPRPGTCMCSKTIGGAYDGDFGKSYVPVDGFHGGVPLEFVKEDVSNL